MFLKKDKRPNGRVYLSIVEGFRDTSTKKPKQRKVKGLEFLDDLEKEYDDPIAFFILHFDRAGILIAKFFQIFNLLERSAYLMSLHTSYSKEVYNFHIKKAMDYTRNNYHKDLSLEYISGYLNLNKCYFCDLFKRETGRTYSHFLNAVRVENSKDLLLNTNLSILNVAPSVGYNNQNYYSMSFKRLTGITPLKYRNMPV